jgi:hypothetical protein
MNFHLVILTFLATWCSFGIMVGDVAILQPGSHSLPAIPGKPRPQSNAKLHSNFKNATLGRISKTGKANYKNKLGSLDRRSLLLRQEECEPGFPCKCTYILLRKYKHCLGRSFMMSMIYSALRWPLL